MIDYALILITNYANTSWKLDGHNYSGLTWLDSSPKPTQEELNSLQNATEIKKAQIICKKQEQNLF